MEVIYLHPMDDSDISEDLIQRYAVSHKIGAPSGIVCTGLAMHVLKSYRCLHLFGKQSRSVNGIAFSDGGFERGLHRQVVKISERASLALSVFAVSVVAMGRRCFVG